MWLVTIALKRPYTFVVMALLIVISGIVTIRASPWSTPKAASA